MQKDDLLFIFFFIESWLGVSLSNRCPYLALEEGFVSPVPLGKSRSLNKLGVGLEG